ncbi:MAG: hypothetical protein IJ392_02495 [Clostridia bacterium]|nr:hypothetical protein [Clostridia bacterium]
MMKLHEKPCRSVRVGRMVYRLRLTYDRVLRAMEAAQDPTLNDVDRQLVMLKLLVRFPRPLSRSKRIRVLQAILELLKTQEKKHSGPPVMSLTQDAALIRGAFRQAYQIDLMKDKLHWSVFCELFSSLPTGTRLADVISIRARPIPKPTKFNTQERIQLMRAKAEVALQLSESERQRSMRQGAVAVARSMLAFAKAKRGETKQ